MSDVVLSIDGLSFGYSERSLFVDWTAEFRPGVTWIVGDEGSGKTSLLKLIAGELPAVAGRFRIGGVLLPQSPAVPHPAVAWCDPLTDVFDNLTPLACFDRLRAGRNAFDAGLLEQHVEGFGLAPHLSKLLYQLSTGSRRKVFLAASLASGAPVTLLDQPFAALDDASARYLMTSLGRCAARPGRAWLVADHVRPAAPLALADTLELSR